MNGIDVVRLCFVSCHSACSLVLRGQWWKHETRRNPAPIRALDAPLTSAVSRIGDSNALRVRRWGCWQWRRLRRSDALICATAIRSGLSLPVASQGTQPARNPDAFERRCRRPNRDPDIGNSRLQNSLGDGLQMEAYLLKFILLFILDAR